VLALGFILLADCFSFGKKETFKAGKEIGKDLTVLEEKNVTEKDRVNILYRRDGKEVTVGNKMVKTYVYVNYEAYLYDSFVRYNGQNDKEQGRTINSYPGRGSDDEMIIAECMQDFRKRTGVENGSYYLMYIYKLDEGEYYSYKEYKDDPYMVLWGILKENGVVRGNILRKYQKGREI
jgi:hypothetical protein